MDSTVTADTAEKVAAAIARSGRTKLAVANAAGIAYTTFGRKLNGHADFTVPEIGRIAKVLEVPPSSLLPASFMPATLAG